MIQTVEAIIDENGKVRFLESVSLSEARCALVTILEEEPTTEVAETALLSEQALAEDWNRSGEDEAWSHLTPISEPEFTLEELLAKVTKRNLHQEVDTGSSLGKEAW
ncbi:MAG TPA: hypothetical protein VGO69_08350 [Pyrinomonadaceae bacterium]|nr:hypothetical protein [Pyrinomonadaceae bacterium]